MKDWIIQVLLLEGGAVVKGDKALHKTGDIIQCFPYKDLGVIGSPRSAFIICRNVPDDLNLIRLGEELEGDKMITEGDIEIGYETIRRHRWRVSYNDALQVDRDELVANKVVDREWSYVKPLIRQKIVTDVDDATTDDETTTVTDEDLM